MDLSQPLSDEEFDELDDFLMSDATLEESMDIAMLDGFLTALLIGPELVMPSAWLPEVWGETPGQTMEWQSARHAERMTSLVLRHMNDILWQLTHDPDHYQPLVYEREHEGEIIPIIDEWCTGFIRGAMMTGDAWAPLFDSEKDEPLLLPIVLYGTETGWRELEAHPELAERHGDFAAALAGCVLAIQDYWMPARKAKATLRRSEPAPGRNDPCPCGSGKKFKKCCGDPGKMH